MDEMRQGAEMHEAAVSGFLGNLHGSEERNRHRERGLTAGSCANRRGPSTGFFGESLPRVQLGEHGGIAHVGPVALQLEGLHEPAAEGQRADRVGQFVFAAG